MTTEEEMFARPIRRKEEKKNTPDRIIENFLPPQFREREERLLPSMAPSGGKETKMKKAYLLLIYMIFKGLNIP